MKKMRNVRNMEGGLDHLEWGGEKWQVGGAVAVTSSREYTSRPSTVWTRSPRRSRPLRPAGPCADPRAARHAYGDSARQVGPHGGTTGTPQGQALQT